MPTHPSDEPDLRATVRLPADVEQEDRVLGPLTARQAAWLAGGALLLWLAFTALHALVPVPLLLGGAAVTGGAWTAIVLGRREGLPLMAWLAAGLRHARSPKLRTAYGHSLPPAFVHPGLAAQHATAAELLLPGANVGGDGTVGLGEDGVVALAECGTVNFALRTASEQQGLVAGFGRWLNSLTGPAQLLIRAEPLDLASRAEQLLHTAPELPHPALEAAAREHAAFLAALTEQYQLLHRRVLLTVREPGTTHGTADRAAQRRDEALRALAVCDVAGAALDGWAAEDALASACTPPPPLASAASEEFQS